MSWTDSVVHGASKEVARQVIEILDFEACESFDMRVEWDFTHRPPYADVVRELSHIAKMKLLDHISKYIEHRDRVDGGEHVVYARISMPLLIDGEIIKMRREVERYKAIADNEMHWRIEYENLLRLYRRPWYARFYEWLWLP